ncbi:MAG TPA: aldehyde dehydrogenase family protein, partial [Anaerolineales bacterium]|nr:aldehyde dehydrogenase family protein [Anaerolineales bacterium]
MRPTLSLFAETGGKNSIIVSALADRDLAVRDIVRSSFGYAGQKCSACSLLILEEEVYHDESFCRQLFDAASSLITGSVWNLDTELGPLIRPPSPHLLRALTELAEGESWLVKPEPHSENPHLWTCGITYGVQPQSKRHTTEFFGPVLSVLSAKTVDEAITIANSTPYGLTAGIHSLDPREQMRWMQSIRAGNCYINRTITGAIVGRQPFGGCKASSFGIGMKAGGPNYLLQLADQTKLQDMDTKKVAATHALVEEARHILTDPQKLQEYIQALHSYITWNSDYFSKNHELASLYGQDNTLTFVPKDAVVVLFQDTDCLLDCLLVLSCCVICDCKALFGMQPQKLHTLKHLVDAVDFDTACQT